MKKPSDDLYRLVRSMSRSEKRYFTLFASQSGGEKSYLQLFDAIARQESYDEEALVRRFAGEKFIRNLSYTKNYLYHLVLKALRLYHSEISADAQLHDLFRSIEILYARGLHDQGLKLLEKAKETARENNRYVAELTAHHWENSLRRATLDLDRLEQYLEEEEEREGEMLERYRNFLAYGRLSQRMFVALRRDTGARDPGSMERFSSIMDNPLLQDEERAVTFESRAHFYDLNGLYARLVQDLPGENLYRRKLLELLEAHPRRIAASPGNYVAALTGYADTCNRLGLEGEIRRCLKLLRELPDLLGGKLSAGERSRLEVLAASRADILELAWYIAAGEFEEGMKAAPPIERRLEETAALLDIPRRNDYLYNLAVLCFGAGRYDRALERINRLLNESEKDVQRDVYGFAGILNLMIHLELGNWDLLEHAVRSVRRSLQRRGGASRFEEAFFRYLREMRGAVDAREGREATGRLLAEVERLEDDPYERRAFEFLDVAAWLRGKLEGTSFGRAIRTGLQRKREERENEEKKGEPEE